MLLLKWATKADISFNAVTNPEFKAYTCSLDPAYTKYFPGRRLLAGDYLEKLHDEATLDLKNIIESLDSYSVEVDKWTSKVTKDDYYAMKIHYIDTNFKKYEKVFNLGLLTDSDNAVNQKKFVMDALKSNGLPTEKMFAFVGDNASTVKKAVSDFNVVKPNDPYYTKDYGITYINCGAHT
jgi:hypothetical protein